MSTKKNATIAANIEKDFMEYAEHGANYCRTFTYTVDDATTLRVLDVMTFSNEYAEEYGECYKAVALRDEKTGNIYIHYNGTGDGNWVYNAVAYGGGPSKVQQESLDFFNRVMETYAPTGTGKVYVSGHSQGGNNAQYAMMMSPYGAYVAECIALDAPGFSEESVERMKALYGENYYNSLREKIHAYNGDRDYVHELGQVNIIPHDQITIIETGDTDFVNSHMIGGMMDGNALKPKAEPQEYESYAVITRLLNTQTEKLPPADQELIANCAMTWAEFVLGDEDKIHRGRNPENLVKGLSLLAVIIFDAKHGFIAGKALDALNQLYQFVNEAIGKLEKFLFSNSWGARYSERNPYMKADPSDLENLATRLRTVNTRLTNLDQDLGDLYLQVGFLDILDILNANLITGYSFRISAAATFLDNAAEKLRNTENAVAGYMGG